MSQPRLSRLLIWERHEHRVVEVLLAALTILRDKPDLPQLEVDLNRKLYFCLLEAIRGLWESGLDGFDHPPTPEGHNPPDPDDEQRAARENKKPDFYWGYIDHLEPDSRRSARYYVIECKRLGNPTSSNWILNQNYVGQGILRFVTEEHGYAKGEKSGAMVGYVQNMDLDDILSEVNGTCLTESIPRLGLSSGGWQIRRTSRLDHELDRPFSESPLHLSHFWVDLRKS